MSTRAFLPIDPEAEVEFSDILEINTLELRKLPSGTDGTELYDWAKFIAAETEELTMIAERNPVKNECDARANCCGNSFDRLLFLSVLK